MERYAPRPAAQRAPVTQSATYPSVSRRTAACFASSIDSVDLLEKLRSEDDLQLTFLCGDDNLRHGLGYKEARAFGIPYLSFDAPSRQLSSFLGGAQLNTTPLSRKDLISLQGAHGALVSIARRYYAAPRLQPARDIEVLARNSLELANAFLSETRTEQIIFGEIPHLLMDFALDSVAKLRGIDRIVLKRTNINECTLLEVNGELVQASGDTENVDTEFVRCQAASFVSTSRRNYATHLGDQKIEASRPRSLPYGTKSFSLAARLTQMLRFLFGRGRGRHLSVLDSSRPVSLRELLFFRFLSHRHAAGLRKTYESLCRDLPTETNFALLSLHYQPEATTLPGTWPLVDQFWVAQTLRSLLPPSIALVVREHPRQFQGSWEGARERSRRDYIHLAATDGISLASVTSNPFDLVDAATFVVTGNGTIGIEAISRGTPVLLFGSAWYESAPGVEVLNGMESSDLSGFILSCSSLHCRLAALNADEVLSACLPVLHRAEVRRDASKSVVSSSPENVARLLFIIRLAFKFLDEHGAKHVDGSSA